MLSLLPLDLPERQLQHLVLRVDHEIQIAVLDTGSKIALLVKKVRHQVQFFTKRIAHFLMNGSLSSTWLLQLQEKRPLIGLVSFVTDYSAGDLLGLKIIDPILCNHPRQLRQERV
jgi:hypothetical protein